MPKLDDDDLLERLGAVHDALEEMIRNAEVRDQEDYMRDIRIRVRAYEGRYYLNVMCYRSKVLEPSVVYAPINCLISPWYRTMDREGEMIWECGVEPIDQ